MIYKSLANKNMKSLAKIKFRKSNYKIVIQTKFISVLKIIK